MTEEFEIDLADIPNMEIPDTEALGWVLDLPLGSVGSLVDRELVLSEDVQEWMDINIRDRYWIFNRFAAAFVYLSTLNSMPIEFNFTSERDYIAFKMRWS
jgi:hypothetical protein